MEAYVESPTESLTQQHFPEQQFLQFLEDVDYDDAALEEMLHNAHREQVYHSQREGLSVGQSSSVSERTVRPVVERGQELNSESEQIGTLLDRQREQILADSQAEIRKHEFQADYDRKSFQKLTETIEPQKEKLHRAQADERRRQDHQLLDEQLLKQNWDLREAHEKILSEMEELKKFQSSTFELQKEINCMNDSRDFQDAESVRSGNSTLPVNQCLSHLIQFLVGCSAVL